MFRNYLTSAFRNLLKFKLISFINLFGLSVGLACCLLILGFVLHELSYDKYHENASRIYRVERSFINPDTGIPSLQLGSAAPSIGPLLKNDFEVIEELTQVLTPGNTIIKYQDQVFNEQGAYYADENFLDVFDVEVVKGNPAKALNDPFSVMMTEELAEKYFNGEDPMNKILRLENQFNLKVTGIYKSTPANSHMHPEMLISFNTLKDPEVYGEEYLSNNWSNNSFFTYILLPENYDAEMLERQLPQFLDRHLGGNGGSVKPSDWTSLNVRPLTDIHLHSRTDLEIEENGDIKRVYIFSAIAIFILLIACINYMNLSTARSVLRAKEIGVRKVMGAGKRELIIQFLSESVMISWIATFVAFGLAWLFFPWLSRLSGQEVSLEILLQWEILLPLLLLPFLVGLVSGFYPALFLSKFQPVKVLKGFSRVGSGGVLFRKVLVVAQFSISIILIIGTIVVFKQLQYMQEKSLGFDREHVVIIQNNSALNPQYNSFRTALTFNRSIREVGRSSLIPTERLLDAMGSQVKRGDSLAPVKADLKFVTADDHFFSTYNIGVKAGRTFSSDFGRDTTSFVINEAAVGALGFQSAEDAVGNQFQYGDRTGTLVGVVNDFHFESLHQRILPLVFFKPSSENNYGRISVRLAGEDLSSGLAHLEKTWKSFVPEVPFEYNFLSSTYEDLYRAELRQGTVFTIFSCIAIGIACLGLFGLSAFTINQRVKEIGIRKVLGADVSSIVALLSKDFLKLVALAAIIAFPVAWYAMHEWLEDFAYRIDIPLWVFFTAGLVAAAVAFLTISYLAVKAATSNPVNNLRID